MFGRRRSLLPLPLRVVVLALFALGIAAEPVLASLGALHALAHEPAGTHVVAHADHAGNVDEHRNAGEEADPDQADPLHALMHIAGCCGQSTATLMPAMGLPPMTLAKATPVLAEPQLPLQARPPALFRPPIRT